MISRRSAASRLTIELGGALGPAWIAQRAANRRARATPLLRVVNLHGTPARDADRLRGHLAWLAQSFRVVDPDRLGGLWHPASEAPGRSDQRLRTLITFDDGLASNYEVAAPILDSLGMRAVFFISPKFAELSGERARDYYYRHVRPHPDVPAHALQEDWQPMPADRVRALAARHAIGNHTLSHVRLDTLPARELEPEIAGSRRVLQEWTGAAIDAFAWTFAPSAIDRESLRMAAAHHRFVFSPCPGTIDPAVDPPSLIWRVNVEAGWTRAAWRFMLSGLGDPRWRTTREGLRHMTRQA